MENALIIQAARFGDLVQTKRLLLSLATNYHVHMAVDHGLVDLARLLYPGASVHGFTFHSGETVRAEIIAAEIHDLRQTPFNAIYNCNFSYLTYALCRAFPRERVFFYRPDQISKGGLLRSSWARLGFRFAAMRSVSPLNLVDYWGYGGCLPPVAPENVNPPAAPGGRGIGVAVAGREERRSIPVEALTAALRTAFLHYGRPPIYLFGASTEQPRARKLMRLFDGPMLNASTNLCGQTDWAELIKALTGLDLLITPDTGIMHLAAHLGVPILALFLSSAWSHETGPYGLGHKIFQASPPCAPCLESAPCAHNLRCHKTFLRTDFARCVGEALDRILPLPWPDGLQLWQTSLDSLGATLLLQRGHDNQATARALARNVAKAKVGLEQAPDPSRDTALLHRLVPDAEWMLPPDRYC